MGMNMSVRMDKIMGRWYVLVDARVWAMRARACTHVYNWVGMYVICVSC